MGGGWEGGLRWGVGRGGFVALHRLRRICGCNDDVCWKLQQYSRKTCLLVRRMHGAGDIMGDNADLPMGAPAVEWAPGEAVEMPMEAPMEVPRKGKTEIERDTDGPVKTRRDDRGEPWFFSELGIRALWARGQGEHVRVGLLDSGVALGCGAFGANVAALDSEGRAAPKPPRDSHGTSCASLIASTDARALGVAPRVSLRSYDVTDKWGVPQVGSIEDAVRAAVAAKCQILSCSFVVREQSPSLLDAFRQALESGVVLVAAAGNDPAKASQFPEDIAGAVVVGAYGKQHQRFGAQRTKFTDTMAPGEEVPVIMPSGIVGLFSQTSAATALAAGLFAAVLSAVGGRWRSVARWISSCGSRRVPRRRACLPVAWTR